MTLTINGQEFNDLPDGLTVADLLERLKITATKIAVECNREIVPKSTFSTTRLTANDKLEIIHFIGGG